MQRPLLPAGIKSYYLDEKAGIAIILGDCRDILPQLESGSIDLVLTDPPYGANYISNYYRKGNPWGAIAGDDQLPVDVIKTCISFACVGVICFLRWDVLHQLPKPKSCIVWIKNNWTAGDLKHAYARQWEMVAFWAGPLHSWGMGRPRDVIEYKRVPPTSLLHPTEKPIGLLQELIRHHQCETVLDPFMGSGTTLRAAKDLGHHAIGIEIEERYCEIAANRLAQEVFPTKETP